MNRQLIPQKLAGAVSSLNEIMAGKGENAYGTSELKQCRGELEALLWELSEEGTKIDPARIAIIAYKALDLVHSWSLDRQAELKRRKRHR